MTNSDLFHRFAHSAKEDSASVNSVFYKNDICYSYGYHFPMAIKVRDKNDNVKFILWNNDSYSNTTSCQQSQLQSALSHFDFIKMYNLGGNTPDYAPTTKSLVWKKLMLEEMKTGVDIAKDAAKKFHNARTTKDSYIASISSEMTRAKTIATEFKLLSKLPNRVKEFFKADTWQAKFELFGIDYGAYKIWLEEKEDKIRLREERKAAKAKIVHAENLEKFRSFEIDSFYGSSFSYLRYNKETNEVETSQRIKINIVEAKRLLRLIDLGKALGDKVDGRYEIVKCNGLFKAGCHSIARSEIESIRNQITN